MDKNVQKLLDDVDDADVDDDDTDDLVIKVVYKEEQTGGGDLFGISHL